MPDLTHAYLAGALFWMAVWGALFLRLKRQRREMAWTGLIFAPAGPVSEFWSLQDYWHPRYILEIRWGDWRFGGLEDVVLGFALSGICAGVFEWCAVRRGAGPLPPVRAWRWGRLAFWPAMGLLVFVAGAAAGLRSVDGLFLAAGACGAGQLLRLRAWGKLAAGLSILFALAYQVFYVALIQPVFPGAIEAVWKLEQTWGIRWGGVPVEEMVWAGLTMLFAGPYLRAALSLRPRAAISLPAADGH